MPKRKAHKEPKSETALSQDGDSGGHKPDPIFRVLAYSGSKSILAAAVGPHIRLLDCKIGLQGEMDSDQGHTGAVRSLALSPSGALLLSGSDDKTVKLWDMETRKCITTWRMHKKLSAVAFTRDNRHALFADKFGDVGVSACGDPAQQQPPSELPELLLGHLCSIITSVTVSPDNKFVVTTDKDGRVRVSVLPTTPLKGAYEIQTYGLGHESFVTTSAYVHGPGHQETLLVTGGGDGTVRLWDPIEGKLLDTFAAARPFEPLPEQQQQQQQQQQADECKAGQEGEKGLQQEVQRLEGREAGIEGSGMTSSGHQGGGDEEGQPKGQDEEEEGGGKGSEKVPTCMAVHHVANSHDGSLVSVVVEGDHEVQVLRVDARSKSLHLQQKLRLPQVVYPCQTAWDNEGRLWVVGGPPCDTSTSLHLGVARLEGQQLVPCTQEVVSHDLLASMEKRNPTEEEQVASGQLVPACNKTLLRRRYFKNPDGSYKHLNNKRPRNDVLENERLAALRQQQQLQQQQQQQQQLEQKA